MSTDVWGGQNDGDYNGLFAIRKSLDGEQSAEFVDKEQFIGIKIGREEFLLTIGVVNEIIMLPHITWVPNGAPFIEGVINLRGTILPVVNVRKMMRVERGEVSSSNRVIICKSESNDVRIGILVDAITFVVALLPDEIVKQSLPSHAGDSDLLSGIGKNGTKVAGIIDMDKIIMAAANGKSLGDDNEAAVEESA